MTPKFLFHALLMVASFNHAFVGMVSAGRRQPSQSEHQATKDRRPHPAQSTDQKKHPTEIQAQRETSDDTIVLLSKVRTLPSEFAADLLLRIAESKRITNQVLKKELVEEAFHLASSAQHPYKLKMIGPYPVDTSAGTLSSSLQLNLDTLSLQCRAVQAMTRIDKKRARELFVEISPIKLKPLACADGTVYDVATFYSTLSYIANTTFNSDEKLLSEDLRFVESYAGNITSPVQIAPVAIVLNSIKASPLEMQPLISSLSNAVGKLTTDDRSFSGSAYDVSVEMDRLIRSLVRHGVSPDELLKALRTFYVGHYSADRCADTLDKELKSKSVSSAVNDNINQEEKDTSLPIPVKRFNELLKLADDAKIPPIIAEDIKPSKVEGGVYAQEYWQSPKGRELLIKVQNLRARLESKRGSGIIVAQKATTEWNSDAQTFLVEVTDWNPANEDSVDVFHQKCLLFKGLLALMPPNEMRNDAMYQYIDFLLNSDVWRNSRVEWFWQANSLIKETYSTNTKIRSNTTDMLSKSNNQILLTYVETAKLTSAATQTPIPRLN